MQMLLVALSRRMCCSRVCKRKTVGGFGHASLLDADDAAGKQALVGIAWPCKRRAGPRSRAARRSAGSSRRRYPRRILPADAGASGREYPPRRWPARRRHGHALDEWPRSRRSSPVVSGYCSRTAKTFSAKSKVALHRPRSTLMPSGSARVWTTAMVCGWQRSLTKMACASACLLTRVSHVHAFRGRGGFVEQGRIGDVQAGQIDDHLLEIDEGLHAPLGNLRLVRRVGGVPAGILEDVPLDDRRDDRAAVTLPQIVLEHAISGRQRSQLGQGLAFPGTGRQAQAVHPAGCPAGTARIGQRLERQARPRVALASAAISASFGAQVPAREGVARCEGRGRMARRSSGGRSRKRVVHRAEARNRGVRIKRGFGRSGDRPDGGGLFWLERRLPLNAGRGGRRGAQRKRLTKGDPIPKTAEIFGNQHWTQRSAVYFGRWAFGQRHGVPVPPSGIRLRWRSGMGAPSVLRYISGGGRGQGHHAHPFAASG